MHCGQSCILLMICKCLITVVIYLFFNVFVGIYQLTTLSNLCNQGGRSAEALKPFHFISFRFLIFIQGKYSSHADIDLQTALLQKKGEKITIKIETI